MSVKKILFVLMIIVLSVTPSWCINGYEPEAAEDSLKILFKVLADADEDNERERINYDIINILSKTLRHNKSFDYAFDSLPLLGKVTASDDMLRIYTWNYPESAYGHKYYCFLQYRENNDGELSLYFLNHVDTDREKLEHEQFGPDNWYGALYYQVHPVNYSDKTIYTLMGFDFNNPFTNIKIIDALSFDDGEPLFGAPLFQLSGKIKNRVVFEYSSQVVMFLRYVPEKEMIVHDHLSPSNPGFKGQYRYYGPDFSYDGFRFDNEKWIHVSDIEWK